MAHLCSVKLKIYIRFIRNFFEKKKVQLKKRGRSIRHKKGYPTTNLVKNVKSERNATPISTINFGIRVHQHKIDI